MKSIKARFEKNRKAEPNHSTYISLAEAINEQDFSKDRIRRWFKKLVDKEEYAEDEKEGVLKHLYSI